jgi:hypothetical protein
MVGDPEIDFGIPTKKSLEKAAKNPENVRKAKKFSES